MVDALARLQVDRGARLGDGSRFLGSFRALGLVVPVWDLADGVEVDQVEDAAAAFRSGWLLPWPNPSRSRAAERRARESLLARQLTVH